MTRFSLYVVRSNISNTSVIELHRLTDNLSPVFQDTRRFTAMRLKETVALNIRCMLIKMPRKVPMRETHAVHRHNDNWRRQAAAVPRQINL
jgi:hypothetical protein